MCWRYDIEAAITPFIARDDSANPVALEAIMHDKDRIKLIDLEMLVGNLYDAKMLIDKSAAGKKSLAEDVGKDFLHKDLADRSVAK